MLWKWKDRILGSSEVLPIAMCMQCVAMTVPARMNGIYMDENTAQADSVNAVSHGNYQCTHLCYFRRLYSFRG